ncbi:MAG: DUF3604 domain-containing protein [Sandaracinaceae bacterium]
MARLVLLAALVCSAGCDPEESPDAAVDAGPPDAGPVDAGPVVVVRSDERETCAEQNPLRNPYFGDLHVHTAVSFDANASGVRTRPRDAYRFARGEALDLPPYDGEVATRTAQLDRPLDFAAVTDHAEFFGEISICSDPAAPGYDSTTCRTYRDGDSSASDYGELTTQLIMPERPTRLCARDPAHCAQRAADVWTEIQEAAEEFQDRTSACSFTTFIGYEWTGTDVGTNLHRNILFRGRSVSRVPSSFITASTPEAMWDEVEANCLDTDTPCDLVSIPHNGNLGGGRMFVPMTEDGTPYTQAQSERRARLEPLVEMVQHKGASECVMGLPHPLASEDEQCNFERLHPRYCDDEGGPMPCADLCEGGGVGFLGGCVDPSDFARGTLRQGLAERARTGANPFEVGFIGSTDTHNSAPGLVDERDWPGHLGGNEDERAEQLGLPTGALTRGRTASPGGLAGVWAEENSREALFDALRRRETWATSGPRIVVRFFGGALDEGLCDDADPIGTADAEGVPMGGVLGAQSTAPVFLVSALRDALGAPLNRIQIIKGWVDGDSTREAVFDVVGPPAVPGTVDEATCETGGEGFDTLCETWTDPDFDPAVPAFYYARVLENPTCRWSRFACLDAGVDCASATPGDALYACCDPEVEHTIQERAWTSPIFYTP